MASLLIQQRQQRRKAVFDPPPMSDAAKIATGKIAAPPTWLGQELPPVGHAFNSRKTILANCQIFTASFGKPLYYTTDDNGLSFKYLCTKCAIGGVKVSGRRILEDVLDDHGNIIRKQSKTVPPFTVVTSTPCDCAENPIPFLNYMNGGGKREYTTKQKFTSVQSTRQHNTMTLSLTSSRFLLCLFWRYLHLIYML